MARYEKIVNHTTSTLDGTINDTATSVTVADGSIWPSEGDYRLRIDNEVLLVTARSSNVLTVERGADSTTAVSHTDGTTLIPVLTADGLKTYIDHITAGASSREAARLVDIDGNRLTSADFTIDNVDGSFFQDQADGSLALISDNTATNNAQLHVAYKTAPTAPWTVTAGFLYHGWDWAGTATTGGIHCRESSTSEFINMTSHGGNNHGVFRWTNPTTFTSTATTPTPNSDVLSLWMRIEDNNTNLIFSISHDGINFFQMLSESRTNFMAGGPDQVGFALSERAWGSASPRHSIILKSWKEE